MYYKKFSKCIQSLIVLIVLFVFIISTNNINNQILETSTEYNEEDNIIEESDHINYEEIKSEKYIEDANNYINNLSGIEKEINQKIFDIRESDLSNEEKTSQITILLAENGNISYKTGSNLFNWNNELFDSDFEIPGCYYKQNMTFDCSGFMQYLIWISTGNSYKNGILIGRGTYFSSIEGKYTEELKIGTILFRYNGGSGVQRTGEELLKNEVPTNKSNHVAIYIGDGKFVDNSESFGGVRIVDSKDNPYYEDYFNWYRDILSMDEYTTDLEIQYQELL